MQDKLTVKKETLQDIPIFSQLAADQLRLITKISSVSKFPKNKLIFLENETYRGFYIVLKGKVKVYKSSSGGKEYILHLVKPPHTFADVPLFEGGNYPANAVALEESVLLFIPKEEFIDLINKRPELSMKMVAGFAKRLKSLSRQIEDLSLKEVTNRLAQYLVEEVKKSGTENLPEPFIKLTISKANIAASIGTITETLSRTFKKLQNENILRIQGRKIFISDFAALKELVDR